MTLMMRAGMVLLAIAFTFFAITYAFPTVILVGPYLMLGGFIVCLILMSIMEKRIQELERKIREK